MQIITSKFGWLYSDRYCKVLFLCDLTHLSQLCAVFRTVDSRKEFRGSGLVLQISGQKKKKKEGQVSEVFLKVKYKMKERLPQCLLNTFVCTCSTLPDSFLKSIFYFSDFISVNSNSLNYNSGTFPVKPEALVVSGSKRQDISFHRRTIFLVKINKTLLHGSKKQ